MWFRNDSGARLFTGGLDNYPAAAIAAAACGSFRADDEDEQCAEEPLSCYNCRYRRWTVESFTCLAECCSAKP